MKSSSILLSLSSLSFLSNIVFFTAKDGLPLIYIGVAFLIGSIICQTIEESTK